MKRFSRWRAFAVPLALGLLGAHVARAAGGGGGGHDALLPVLEALVLVLLAARLGGSLFTRLGMPAVLGELVAGAVLATLAKAGLSVFQGPDTAVVLDTLAQLGVLFLLFSVGLESDVARLAAVGRSALFVAVIGVVAPMALGIGVSAWMHPGQSMLMHAFIGATLSATSVGLTARVLSDIGRAASVEGRIILGAAVIDDVMGLIILAVVAGIIKAADAGTTMSSTAVFWLIAKALLFLIGAIALSRLVYKPMFKIASYLKVHGMLLITSLASCFAMSFIAAKVGLAPIVGAFAAGLVLEEVYYRDKGEFGKHSIEELLEPLALFLVPIFFVKMGMDVDLSTFAKGSVLGFALVLTLAAIIGKQVSAFGVVRAKKTNVNRWIVGLGMIPRGEVGLIFAGIGLSLSFQGEAVVTPEVYSAVVIMVILTTLVTPPVLTWSFRKKPLPRL